MSGKVNILYVSSLCSKDVYAKKFRNSDIKPGLQIQKYHRLMVEGFAKNEGVNITALSAIPMNSSISSKKLYKKYEEKNDNISYIYMPFINITILRQIILFIYSFCYTLGWGLENKNGVVICDILNISISSGACFASKIIRVKNVGIVTDVPTFLLGDNSIYQNYFKKQIRNIILCINTFVMNKFNSYVFLTEQMNELINKKNKKFLVIEGQVDINMDLFENNIENKYSKKVCIYAGLLKKLYGIKNLTEAFIKADIDNSELHIYGSGDYEDELIEVCKNHKNIKYCGTRENDYVIKEQLKASVLINPRPSNEEYTKYSFPSKNMEYLVSGTPTITTNLPGMPKEYKEYVYLINDESIEGICDTLKFVLSKSEVELNTKGLKAKEFALREKNNVIQANKILDMINRRGENEKI